MPQAHQAATDPDYEAPRFEIISLDCEITSYAPEAPDDRPLF